MRQSDSTNRRLTAHAQVVSLALVCLLGAASIPGSAQEVSQAPAATFRVGVDLVAVDVQVIDRDGRPVAGLGPDKFDVRINGGRRRVVSADFIEGTTTSPGSSLPPKTTPTPAGPSTERPAPPPRTIVLAVDCLSFDPGVSRQAIEAARTFVKRLPAADLVGVYAYPSGPKLDPTTDRDAVLRALDQVVGQRETSALSQFHLRPSEIIDLMAMGVTGNMGSGATGSTMLDAVAQRECSNDPSVPVDESCRSRLMLEVTSTAIYLEGQAHASLGMFRSLLKEMGTVPGRKTVVVVSGGMIASDRPGGRPDINDMGIMVGKEAARSNTAVYSLFIDSSYTDRSAAETRRADKNQGSLERDSQVLGRWLEHFSESAGGAMFKVMAGTSDAAFDRILSETSSYYLLGVEPAEADRDGRTHEVTVKTSQRNVIVRGRRWVAVPKRGGILADTATTAPAAPTAPAASRPTRAATPAPRVVPREVQQLVDLFDHGDDQALESALARTSDLANLIRAFRASDDPWPNAPRRTAVLALELAVAGLRSGNGYARDEGGRLLAQFTTLVRQPERGDAFECAWLWTEIAALEGLFLSDSAMLFVPRAVERCPNHPRFLLARAILSEQQWLRGGTSAPSPADVTSRYTEGMRFPETDVEARVRAAWFLSRTGNAGQALGILGDAPGPSGDRQVRYLADLVRGQVLRALGRPEEAAAAFRAALETWPGAQSARVSLMTILVARGERQAATVLADAAETAPDDQFDPWWMYWLGDYRAYPGIVAKLRELAR